MKKSEIKKSFICKISSAGTLTIPQEIRESFPDDATHVDVIFLRGLIPGKIQEQTKLTDFIKEKKVQK